MRAHAGTEIFRVLGQKMVATYHRPAGPEGKRFPTVLFLHGFPGSEKSVDVQRELMRRGIASVAPAFLGAWGSGGKYRFTTLVPQARAALRAAKKLSFVNPRRVAVYGYSMGGWVALNLAALEPSLKAVVAIASAGGPEMIGSDTKSFLAHLSKPLNVPAQGDLLGDFRRAHGLDFGLNGLFGRKGVRAGGGARHQRETQSQLPRSPKGLHHESVSHRRREPGEGIRAQPTAAERPMR